MTGTWIRGVTAAAIISALALALAPRGPGRSALKLACGAVTVIMLIMPLKGFDIGRYAVFAARQRLSGSEIAERAEEDSLTVKSIIIEGRTRAYILDKAAELGIEAAQAEVELAVQEGTPYPAAVRLSGAADSEARVRLSEYLEGQLGIPGECQYWYTDDENTDP